MEREKVGVGGVGSLLESRDDELGVSMKVTRSAIVPKISC